MRITPRDNPQKRRLNGRNAAPGQGGRPSFRLDARPIRDGPDFSPFPAQPGAKAGGVLFSLGDDYVIDANIDGNVARWINHSCAPNCEATQVENAKGKQHKSNASAAIRSLRKM